MDNNGYKIKRTSSAGGIIRRAVIFVLVAGAAGTGIWFLYPHTGQKTDPVPPQEQPIQPPAPQEQPVETPAPVQEEPLPALPPERKDTPPPAEDPELTVEAAPAAPAPQTAEKTADAPPVKGIPHATDPADEEPYSAPDLIPTQEFESKLAAIRANSAAPAEQLAQLRKLLQETAFSSPQYRTAAQLLNTLTAAGKAEKISRTVYIVQPGDSLIRLARKHHLSTAQLAAENGLSTRALLKIGQKLTIPAGIKHWSVRISKRPRLLRLYCGNDLFAVYDIGIGRQDLTPTGRFILRETVDDPPYPLPQGGMAKPGSPENQLGPCWLGLGDSLNRPTGYGIHGTPDESSVTRNLSAGCVRMRNKEVLELRTRIPAGTPVIIEN